MVDKHFYIVKASSKSALFLLA